MAELTLATQTLFAELLQRCLDAEFDTLYGERGRFVRVRSGGRLYWHYRIAANGKRQQLYVGPVADRSITDRVKRFGEIKSDYKGRREMVRALLAAGVPAPDPLSGAIVEAMWKAGFFRLRGVLVGTVAFQAYAGPLGLRLPGQALQTQDVDFAQFWSISQNIGESLPPILQVLRGVDATFTELPNAGDPFITTSYRNRAMYRVDFLTPNRGSADLGARPVAMKALGGAAAQPLRHLDYLIHEPERSLLLTNGGVPVSLPRAERYAVHKLMVAAERRDQIKASKDIAQAAVLLTALAARRPVELTEAWAAAWSIGPRWRKKLIAGRARLPVETDARRLTQRLEESRVKNRYAPPSRLLSRHLHHESLPLAQRSCATLVRRSIISTYVHICI
jgi:hypothetical protein